jgi:hypothetical protein
MPTSLTMINTVNEESMPVLSPDGLELFYSTDVSGTRDVVRAFRLSRTAPFGAGSPLAVAATIADDEEPEELSRDGLRLYFVKRAPPDGLQFFVATRATTANAFGAAQPVMELNAGSADQGLALSTDELEVFFASDRAGGPGMLDVYTASRASRADVFGPAVVVPELSTVNEDLTAQLSSDGTTLYLNYDMSLGAGAPDSDVWIATRTCLAR